MLDYLSLDHGGKTPIDIPNAGFLKGAIKSEIAKVHKHHAKSGHSVIGEHILVRILLASTIETKLVDTFRGASKRKDELAFALNLANGINPYRESPNHFYGEDVVEVMTAIDEDTSPFEYGNNWENIVPVRVLRHPSNAWDLNLLDTKDKHVGVGVIGIDIVALVCQFSMWRESQLKSEKDASPQRYVRALALPLMTESKLTCVLRNKALSIAKKEPLLPTLQAKPLLTTNLDSPIEDYLRKSLFTNAKVQPSLTGINLETDLLLGRSMLSPMDDHPTVVTIRNEFSFVLAAFPYIELMLIMRARAKYITGTVGRTTFKRAVRRWNQNKALKDRLSSEMQDILNDGVENQILHYL